MAAVWPGAQGLLTFAYFHYFVLPSIELQTLKIHLSLCSFQSSVRVALSFELIAGLPQMGSFCGCLSLWVPTEVIVSPLAVARMAGGDSNTSVRQPLPTDKFGRLDPALVSSRAGLEPGLASAERAGNPSRQRQRRGTNIWAGRAEVALILPNLGFFF